MSSSRQLSRRAVSKHIAAGAAFAFFSGHKALAEAAKSVATTLEGLGPVAETMTRPIAEQFWVLSRLVTGRDGLSRKNAERMFPLFAAEPWGENNVSALLRKTLDGLSDPRLPNTVSELMDIGLLDEDQLWFATHLMTTWYLGIYYFEGREERVLYEDALMWEVVADFVQVPGFSEQEYGYWTNPPVPREGDG